MEKKRYGKQLKIELKATIKENGNTRTIFYPFPNQGFDSPKNCLFHVVGWFFKNFEKFDWLDSLWAGLWFDENEAKSINAREKIKDWVHAGLEKEHKEELEALKNE